MPRKRNRSEQFSRCPPNHWFEKGRFSKFYLLRFIRFLSKCHQIELDKSADGPKSKANIICFSFYSMWNFYGFHYNETKHFIEWLKKTNHKLLILILESILQLCIKNGGRLHTCPSHYFYTVDLGVHIVSQTESKYENFSWKLSKCI